MKKTVVKKEVPQAAPQVAAVRTLADFFPQVKQTPIGALVPYVNNAKVHGDDQVTMLAASIKEFGFINPVVVDGAGVIVAGHGRVAAAERLGLTEVPTIEVKHLTEAQVKALRIADNRLSQIAVTDGELLRLELEVLKEQGVTDFVGMGFTKEEVADLLRFGSGGDMFNPAGKKEPVTYKCPKCGREFDK